MSNNFCVVPFYYHHQHPARPCCWLSSLCTADYLRESFLNGIIPPECNMCKTAEDLGQTSRRQQANILVDSLLDLDIENIEKQCVRNENKEIVYELQLSKQCNSTCVTCNESSSTSWSKIKGLPIVPQTGDVNVDYQTAKYISFVGGEPLLEKAVLSAMQSLINCGNTSCHISLVTNGSVINNKIMTLLSHFPRKDICISIDATGKLFDYIRFPLEWKVVSSNLIKFRKIADVSVSFTISNLNIHYISEIEAWFKMNKLPFIRNVVQYPLHFSPYALPLQVKRHLISTINDPLIHNILVSHNEQHEQWFVEAQKQLAYQDQLKGIQLKDYAPEIANIFGLG